MFIAWSDGVFRTPLGVPCDQLCSLLIGDLESLLNAAVCYGEHGTPKGVRMLWRSGL
jgi:hypothetical protein